MISAEPEGPIHISNNNIKNYVSVDLDANAVVSNNNEHTIINVLLAALNQQAALVAAGQWEVEKWNAAVFWASRNVNFS